MKVIIALSTGRWIHSAGHVLLSCGRLHEELRFCLPWSDDGDHMFLKVHPFGRFNEFSSYAYL